MMPEEIAMKRPVLLKLAALLAVLILAAVCVCAYGEETEETPETVERHAKYDPKTFTQVGKYVFFGVYEQDGNEENGSEPIEWIVLDYDDDTDQVLLLSRYVLDAAAYNSERAEVTWETCSLRAWLNDEFLNKAFCNDEKLAIIVSEVDNSREQGCSDYLTDGGNKTEDPVFLLSYAEAGRYLKENKDRQCVPTPYAVANGILLNKEYQVKDSAACWWWLRSPGRTGEGVTVVYADGSHVTNFADLKNRGVRPAIRIDLSAGTFHDDPLPDD